MSSDGKELTITTLAQLLDRLRGRRVAGDVRWYRGQSDITWGLTPAVFRNRGHLENEVDILKKFRQNAIHRVQRLPSTEWEWIFLAQHHGVPTRLLDWSENPLVALYFATDDIQTDGYFYELDPVALNSLATKKAPKVVMFDHDDVLNHYLPSVDDALFTNPLAAIAGRPFDRIVAQMGTFTVSKFGEDLLSLPESTFIERIRILRTAKTDLRAELADLNINESTVYPDLTHLATFLKEQFRK